MRSFAIVLSLCWFSLAGLSKAQTPDDPATFSIATKPFGQVIEMVGYITFNTQSRFEQVADANPQVKTLWIRSCDGSEDDNANVIFCRYVYDNGFSTYMEAEDESYSGGVDLFVSGVQRYAHPSAILGVHSWSDGNGLNAANLPANDPEHQRYITLYTDMWMTQTQAEDFYFYTINAAPPWGIHNMTANERVTYKINTTAVWPPIPKPFVLQNLEISVTETQITGSLEWESEVGRTYKVQHSSDLSSWIDSITGISGTGNPILRSVTLENPENSASMFFRLARE